MKLHKGRIAAITLIIMITLGFAGYLMISGQNDGYIRISKEQKEQIQSIIDDCKSLRPDLQSSESRVSWIGKAFDEQMQLMSNVLESLTVLGESEYGRPKQYYRAAYFTDQEIYIYIEKSEKSPHKSIIIQVREDFYVAKSKEEYVAAVIQYLRKQGVY